MTSVSSALSTPVSREVPLLRAAIGSALLLALFEPGTLMLKSGRPTGSNLMRVVEAGIT